MSDRPIRALVLLVIGVVFYAAGVLRVGARGVEGFHGAFVAYGFDWFTATSIGVLLIALAIVGAVLVSSRRAVRKGSFLTLFMVIFGFAIFLVVFHAALLIGSILSLVAAILGLRWKPSVKQP